MNFDSQQLWRVWLEYTYMNEQLITIREWIGSIAKTVRAIQKWYGFGCRCCWFFSSVCMSFFTSTHRCKSAMLSCFILCYFPYHLFHFHFSIYILVYWSYLCCLFACSLFIVWCIYVLPCGLCTNMNIYYAKRRRTKQNNNNRKNQRKLNGFCNRNYSTALRITSMAKTHWNCYNIFNEQLMRIRYYGTNTNYNTENVIEIQMHR